MRYLQLFILFTILLYGCGAKKTILTAEKQPVRAYLDLVDIIEDKVQVTLDPGEFSQDDVTFYIPKTVPGTYSIDNYGQYIEGIIAYDYDGEELAITNKDKNSWYIQEGKKLDKLVYYVNDTYDTESQVSEAVFSPAGLNIKKGDNYMLNLHGFVGYFNDLKEVPYELFIKVPSELEATTSLSRLGSSGEAGIDTFGAQRYFEVIDNPIFYGRPNTTEFKINDINVTISVYSPNNVYSANSLKESMEKMMSAQKTFLGTVDGTKTYTILVYLSTLAPDDAAGFGALEHHTSTVVVLPEQMPKEALEAALIDVVSHEFFHILTPLNVHSEEIHFFDYNDPKMSQHLWMYEGTTEYFANLFQIQQSLISEEEFYQRLVDKMQNSKIYDDSMSFTEMSARILESPYKSNYANVYEKGALINMALDIRLRELSGGEKGVLWLMKQLSQKYDMNSPFRDDQLIEEIVSLTFPEIREFFNTYVVGDQPIDYSTFLAKVGLLQIESEEPSGFFLKDQIPYIDVDLEENNIIFVRKGITLNSFFKDLGAQGGDVIKEINGIKINLDAIRPIIGESFGWGPDKEIEMIVLRDGEEIKLSGKAGTPTVLVQKVVPDENASETLKALRNSWLKG